MRYCESPNQDMLHAEDNLVFRGRILWRDIATWLRAYLVYLYLGTDQKLKELVKDKLMSLSEESGSLMRVFFGDRIADDYTAQLITYITLFLDLFNAQKNGDENAANKYKQQIYEVVEQRADFLSRINPFWEKNTVLSLLNTFASMTIDEANSYLSKDYERALHIFDSILSFTNVVGDYIAEGILNYLKYSAR